MGIKEFFQECKCIFFWRAVLSELLATILFVFVITSVSIDFGMTFDKPVETIKMCLPTGFSMAFLLKTFGPISGGYVNPALSMGAFVNGDISSVRATMYSIAQYVGGILGAGLTYFLTPEEIRSSSNSGAVVIGKHITVTQAFFGELVLTFTLTLVFLACHDKRINHGDGPSSIIIGFTYIALHFTGKEYSGGSFNPARAFGPSIVSNAWEVNSWIYLAAPYVGATIGSLLHRFVMSTVELKKETGTNDGHLKIEINKETAVSDKK